jgi:hypothetical protein
VQHDLAMIKLANDARMRGLEPLAEEFYEKVLRPDEEPGFVSDEASLLDFSLAPEELLIDRIKAHYGKTVTTSDLQKPFWLLVTDLNEVRTPADIEGPSEGPQRKSSWRKLSALTVGIIAAFLTLGLYLNSLSFGSSRIISGVVFPGLLVSMAIVGNAHAVSLWVAAGFNGIFYCSLTWTALSLASVIGKWLR